VQQPFLIAGSIVWLGEIGLSVQRMAFFKQQWSMGPRHEAVVDLDMCNKLASLNCPTSSNIVMMAKSQIPEILYAC
jgi:hypothetical protein